MPNDVRLSSSGNIQVRWHAANAFVAPAKPTPTEVNGGLNITDDVSWNDWSFGVTDANTTNDPSLKSKSNVADLGTISYGGSISLYLPESFTDMSNTHAVAFAALSVPRTVGWITIQIDGDLSETNTPTYSGGMVQTAAAGDLIHVFKVQTGGYSPSITGEESFRETISFLPQGEAYVYAVVAVTNVVVVTPATLTLTVAAKSPLAATVNARRFTRGVKWTSSNGTLVTVSPSGVLTRLAAGAATITATYNGVTATCVVS